MDEPSTQSWRFVLLLFLNVPAQIEPIPQSALDAAYKADVLIRDIKGKTC